MVRSGWGRRRGRAGSPTMMLPSGSRLTTEGHSVELYGPGIHLGWPVCASTYATRLLVVPRSIPTMRPINSSLPVILFPRRQPGFECRSGGSAIHLSAAESLRDRIRWRWRQGPRPIVAPRSSFRRLLREVFRRNSSRRRAAWRLIRPDLRPLIWLRAIRRAIRSARTLLPAIQGELAACARLPCAYLRVPADIRRARRDREGRGRHRSAWSCVGATFPVRVRWYSQN